MAEAKLEKMRYRFNVISDYYGNTYILDKVQRWLAKAIEQVQKSQAMMTYSQTEEPKVVQIEEVEGKKTD